LKWAIGASDIMICSNTDSKPEPFILIFAVRLPTVYAGRLFFYPDQLGRMKKEAGINYQAQDQISA
jgi:hypothetical protein